MKLLVNFQAYFFIYILAKVPPCLSNVQNEKKQLSLCSTISFLDVKGIFLYLQVELNIMDIH